MSTKTVQTAYGETTIEVVECDSCGAEVAKDDALEFTLGEREGRACEHCYDSGPISFPTSATDEGYIQTIISTTATLPRQFWKAVNAPATSSRTPEFAYGVIATLAWLVVFLFGYNLVV